MTVPVTPVPATLQCVYTTLGWKVDGEPIVVAFTSCGRCGQHVVNCKCVGGFIEPAYITRMRERSLADAPTAVGSTDSTPSPVVTPDAPSGGESNRVPSGTPRKARLPHCATCGKEVTDDDADRNDDGSWTCFACQEAS